MKRAHIPGIWSGNMIIEMTFMRYDEGPGGIIGNTLKSDKTPP